MRGPNDWKWAVIFLQTQSGRYSSQKVFGQEWKVDLIAPFGRPLFIHETFHFGHWPSTLARKTARYRPRPSKFIGMTVKLGWRPSAVVHFHSFELSALFLTSRPDESGQKWTVQKGESGRQQTVMNPTGPSFVWLSWTIANRRPSNSGRQWPKWKVDGQ